MNSLVSTDESAGLQCHTALFSWKVVVSSSGSSFELLFSACSASEEKQWMLGIREHRQASCEDLLGGSSSSAHLPTKISPVLKPATSVFETTSPLARRMSVRRAATLGNRPSICHVIIRNTHKQSDHRDGQRPAMEPINRSQSLFTTHRSVVMAPKRNERIRLEHDLADVWTRAELPYPGMASSRSSHIIRASAGSMVRKLSLASMHSPFARRSASLTAGATLRKSNGTLLDADAEPEGQIMPDIELNSCAMVKMNNPVDTIEEMADKVQGNNGSCVPVEPSARQPQTIMGNVVGRDLRKQRRMSKVGPDDAAAEVYVVEQRGEGRPGGRKRWSNPLALLKTWSPEVVRNMLHSP